MCGNSSHKGAFDSIHGTERVDTKHTSTLTALGSETSYHLWCRKAKRMNSKLGHRLREPWNLSWQEFDLVLGERRLVDCLNLQIHTLERATTLLKNCGLDVARPEQRRQSECILGESIHFLRHSLMTNEERSQFPVPSRIRDTDDLRLLLVIASDQTPRYQYERFWACAILKIAHAIVNLEFNGMLEDLPLARKQIFNRIKRCIRTGAKHDEKTPQQGTGFYFEHPGSEPIQLSTIDWKEEKSRTSLILKLIHKSDNLSDDVFDYIGVRFVVRDNHDIPLLIDGLIRRDIIIPHQVIASRSKNTLIDIARGKRLLKLAKDLAGHGELSEAEFEVTRRNVDWGLEMGKPSGDKGNRFSSQQYRSVQLTVKHLVRLRNPAHTALSALSAQLEHYQNIDRSDHWLDNIVPEQKVRFFPLEIQIMDVKSYEDSRFGPSSHERYKKNQHNAARQKILGPLLGLHPSIIHAAIQSARKP